MMQTKVSCRKAWLRCLEVDHLSEDAWVAWCQGLSSITRTLASTSRVNLAIEMTEKKHASFRRDSDLLDLLHDWATQSGKFGIKASLAGYKETPYW